MTNPATIHTATNAEYGLAATVFLSQGKIVLQFTDTDAGKVISVTRYPATEAARLAAIAKADQLANSTPAAGSMVI